MRISAEKMLQEQGQCSWSTINEGTVGNGTGNTARSWIRAFWAMVNKNLIINQIGSYGRVKTKVLI